MREHFGVMYAKPKLRDFIIIVSSDGLISSMDSPVIVLNANNREKAVARLFEFGLLEY